MTVGFPSCVDSACTNYITGDQLENRPKRQKTEAESRFREIMSSTAVVSNQFFHSFNVPQVVAVQCLLFVQITDLLTTTTRVSKCWRECSLKAQLELSVLIKLTRLQKLGRVFSIGIPFKYPFRYDPLLQEETRLEIDHAGPDYLLVSSNHVGGRKFNPAFVSRNAESTRVIDKGNIIHQGMYGDLVFYQIYYPGNDGLFISTMNIKTKELKKIDCEFITRGAGEIIQDFILLSEEEVIIRFGEILKSDHRILYVNFRTQTVKELLSNFPYSMQQDENKIYCHRENTGWTDVIELPSLQVTTTPSAKVPKKPEKQVGDYRFYRELGSLRVYAKGKSIGEVPLHGFFDRTTYIFQNFRLDTTACHIGTNQKFSFGYLGDVRTAKFSSDWSSLHFFRDNYPSEYLEYCRFEIPEEKAENKESKA